MTAVLSQQKGKDMRVGPDMILGIQLSMPRGCRFEPTAVGPRNVLAQACRREAGAEAYTRAWTRWEDHLTMLHQCPAAVS